MKAQETGEQEAPGEAKKRLKDAARKQTQRLKPKILAAIRRGETMQEIIEALIIKKHVPPRPDRPPPQEGTNGL